MRIVNFIEDGDARLGVRLGDRVVDLSLAAPHLPRDLGSFFSKGPQVHKEALAAAEAAAPSAIRKFSELRILPPVHKPGKFICLGANFMAHLLEAFHITGDAKKPEFPPVFLRVTSSLAAHGQSLLRPKISDELDWECELAVIIGRTARHVKETEALSYVGGYACFNDGSVRDYQLRTSQWTLGKNFDQTGGFGPDCVTADELPAGAVGLRMQTRLNGEVMQDSNTADMIFGVAQAISLLSECMTLHPGDVIAMGTCEGVGLTRKPPVYMKPGDVCEVEIEGLGILTNPIAQE